jgi:DNA modification methylase
MVQLVERFIDQQNGDEPVIDLTAGSGTTGIGAIRNGRRCILIERQEHYCREMATRFDAELDGVAPKAARAGQLGLFGEASRRTHKSETPAGGAAGVSGAEVA